MTFQEVYSLVDYYDCVLFVVILLQEHVKDFLSTVVCFLMSYSSQIIIPILMQQGYDFYSSAILYESIFFCIGIFLIGSKVGWILVMVCFGGVLFNLVGVFLSGSEFYSNYQKSYGVFNIIMFEILVWACIANSRIKPYIEEYTRKAQTYIQNKIATGE